MPKVVHRFINVHDRIVEVRVTRLKGKDGDWGEGPNNTRIIRVHSRLDDQGMWQAFFHELNHEAMKTFGFLEPKPAIQETIAELMAVVQYKALKRFLPAFPTSEPDNG